MLPKEFIEGIAEGSCDVPGTLTLKKIAKRLSTCDSLSLTFGRMNWSNHRDYNKYNPAKHTIMCCGWTDWHDHRDTC